MDRIHVRVDKKIKQGLEAEASAKGVSLSEIVRQLLREHLERRVPRETAYEAAKRLGIIGSAKGLPSDLSTNPAHMEGFERG